MQQTTLAETQAVWGAVFYTRRGPPVEGVGYQYSRGGEVLIKQKQLWCSLSRKHDFIFRNDLSICSVFIFHIDRGCEGEKGTGQTHLSSPRQSARI